MLKEISYKELHLNPMTLIGEQWWAVAAGNETDGYNAMTAAWGQLGTLWERTSHANRLPAATVYIRPSRYTHQFMEKEDYFTLNILKPEDRRVLGILGAKHGSDCDKFAMAGITPYFTDGTTAIAESDLVLVCHKIYVQDIKPECFTDTELVPFNYPHDDYHTMYIGEIEKVLKQCDE